MAELKCLGTVVTKKIMCMKDLRAVLATSQFRICCLPYLQSKDVEL